MNRKILSLTVAAAVLAFIKKTLTGMFANRIAEIGTGEYSAAPTIHVLASTRDVFRSAKGSSGKSLIAEQRNLKERRNETLPRRRWVIGEQFQCP
jgi:hypothetical protein